MIKKPLLILSISALAGMASAQVFEPVHIRTDDKISDKNNSLTVQFSTFKWDVPGAHESTNFLLAGDFNLGHKASVGFWTAPDRQFDTDITWFELHTTAYLRQTNQHSIGVMLGYLDAHLDDGFATDDGQWFETALVGAIGVGGSQEQVAKTRIGATLGYAFGQDSSHNNFKTASGISYGLSASHSLSQKWSVDAAAWILDLTKEGGAKISRYSIGIGYHF